MSSSLSKLFLPEELAGLTEKRVKVYDRLIAGETEKAISQSLGMVRDTVHSHIKAIYKTANVKSRPELAAMLITRLGLLMAKLNKQELELPAPSDLAEGEHVPLARRLIIDGSGEVRSYGQDAEQSQQATL